MESDRLTLTQLHVSLARSGYLTPVSMGIYGPIINISFILKIVN
jgi:hypothetical protein